MEIPVIAFSHMVLSESVIWKDRRDLCYGKWMGGLEKRIRNYYAGLPFCATLALSFVLLTGWQVCLAQDTTAYPGQTASSTEAKPESSSASATQPANDQASDKTKSSVGSPPIPRAGDPFYAPIAATAVPQSFHQRLMDYAVITFGPRSLLTPLLSSALSMSNPPECISQ